jgi:hypothetical protein
MHAAAGGLISYPTQGFSNTCFMPAGYATYCKACPTANTTLRSLRSFVSTHTTCRQILPTMAGQTGCCHSGRQQAVPTTLQHLEPPCSTSSDLQYRYRTPKADQTPGPASTSCRACKIAAHRASPHQPTHTTKYNNSRLPHAPCKAPQTPLRCVNCTVNAV